MSSTFSSPPRTWWSLSPKSTNPVAQDLRRGYSTEKHSQHSPAKHSGLTFNTFASAMGFKSKKHPSLAIQDPPLQSQTITPPMDGPYGQYAARPISKSTSSTRSRVDSLEPRTPVDPQRDPRPSLLTLSDVDPFAVRAISAPHTPSDINRLSAYSNSSIPEFVSKHAESSPMLNRVSYASSSSHSNQHGSELSPHSSTTPSVLVVDPNLGGKLKPKKSRGSLHRKQSLISSDGTLVSAWESLTHHGNQVNIVKSGSSLTLTDKNRFSQPDPTPTPRPPMRVRGMTDSGANQIPKFLQQEGSPSKASHPAQKPSPTSPRVVIRQPSVSRIGSPPSAPPRHELPPPPTVRDINLEDLVASSTGSASSSTLSFASSVSSNKDIPISQPYSARQQEKRHAERTAFPSVKPDTERAILLNQSTVPRTLKKALSHQSLVKRTPSSPSPISTPLLERPVEKVPRKQRSFYQAKTPIPPVPPPMRNLKPSGSQSLSSSSSTPVVEQRRGSASGISTSGRKRLFSSSSSHRRPSTSQCIMSEDDNHSIFSVRSDPDPTYGSSFNPLSPTTSSFWDEGTPDITPISPNPAAHEYMPQQIMSPAEMAEVEASVEESAHIRKRGLSILSTSTTITSDGDEEANPTSRARQPLWDSRKSDSLLVRSTSLLDTGLTVPPRLGLRPSTSQANMTTSSNSIPSKPSSSSSPSSPSHALTSLPPPPRPRQRPVIVPRPPSEERADFALLPPPRRHLRPKLSVEKILHRRSVMRKPSFLEIDDDSDQESDIESTGEILNSSFLDLARESFDTVRTISE